MLGEGEERIKGEKGALGVECAGKAQDDWGCIAGRRNSHIQDASGAQNLLTG